MYLLRKKGFWDVSCFHVLTNTLQLYLLLLNELLVNFTGRQI